MYEFVIHICCCDICCGAFDFLGVISRIRVTGRETSPCRTVDANYSLIISLDIEVIWRRQRGLCLLKRCIMIFNLCKHF